MFSIGDDFDIDEDFLGTAFEGEPSNKRNISSSENSSECSSQISIQDNSSTHANKKEAKVPLRNRKNDEFLDLWNANEKDLFFSKSPEKWVNPRNFLDVARAESPQGLKSDVVTRVSKSVVPRKFPGPAGLLPERTCNTSFLAAAEYISRIEKEDESFPHDEDEEVLSQASSNLFEEPGGAWVSMLNDLGTNGSTLLSAINLSTIRVKQARFGFKVPFLAVCVHNIDCSLPDPMLLLKDPKDEMHGTLHREVWEEWKGDILVGSVLVLQNSGIVTAGMSSRRYFLNITANNITAIYTPKQDSSLKITQIKSVSGLDSSQIIDEWERVMNQTRLSVASNEPQTRPLFSTFSPLPQVSSSTGPQTFHPFSSPCSSRSSSPAFVNRPSPLPSRPVFRPRTPVQVPPHRQGTPVQQSHINRSQNFRVPVVSSPGLSNSHLKKPVNTQGKVIFQQSAPTKPPSFIPKNEVLKQNVNSPFPQTGKPSLYSPKNPEEELTFLPYKKPKVSSKENEPSKSVTPSVFSIHSDDNSSIVESVLDGIDPDEFFDDF